MLVLGLLLGCPGADEGAGETAPASAVEPPALDPAFGPQAHAKALAVLRQEVMPSLRLLDPVAAAEVEGGPLHPPSFGATARADLRAALDGARRAAEGIRADSLSPQDAVVLRTLSHALERGRSQLERPPWRDDPSALVSAVEPYVSALRRRAAAGRCEDGCGLAELGPALAAGVAEVGASSVPALGAAREDLAALRRELPRLGEGLPATHALVTAMPGLTAALDELDARLAQAAATLPTAEERPWSEPVPPAEPAAWKRRPARFTADRLRHGLEAEEAYGLPPARLFALAERTVARLSAMQRRDAAREGPLAEPTLPRPFDGTACAAAWAPLRTWVQAQGSELVAELDCATLVRRLPPAADDVAIVRQLLVQGVIEPTRRARVAATGVDVALVQGRATPLAQALVLEVAIASGSGHPTAMQHALRQAHHRGCLAAAAVWIHGELGDDTALRARLDPHGCGDTEPLVAAATARPGVALHGLGLLLLGDGPADAAALDRYSWAPLGLVRDLALPPPPLPPVAEVEPAVRIEALGDAAAARQRIEALGPADTAP